MILASWPDADKREEGEQGNASSGDTHDEGQDDLKERRWTKRGACEDRCAENHDPDSGWPYAKCISICNFNNY